MFDSFHTVPFDLVGHHSHQEGGHQLDTCFQRQQAAEDDAETHHSVHPLSHGGEVVADGQHHQSEEQIGLQTPQIVYVLELQGKERVVVALVDQGKSTDHHKIPENMPQSP